MSSRFERATFGQLDPAPTLREADWSATVTDVLELGHGRVMRVKLAGGFLALACLAVGLAACGGQIIVNPGDGGLVPVTSVVSGGQGSSSSGDAGAASSGENGSSGGSGTDFPECPATQPEPGFTCTTPNQGCAYVDLQAGTCASWTCSKDHVWVVSTPAGC